MARGDVHDSGGMRDRGRGHAWLGGGVQERRPLQRAVRILLECILVYQKVF